MQCWQGGKGGGGRGTGRSAPLSAWTAVAPFWSHRRNTVNAGTAKKMGLGNHSRVCCIRGLSSMLFPSHNRCRRKWNRDGTLYGSKRLKIKRIQNSFRYRPHENRMWWQCFVSVQAQSLLFLTAIFTFIFQPGKLNLYFTALISKVSIGAKLLTVEPQALRHKI